MTNDTRVIAINATDQMCQQTMAQHNRCLKLMCPEK